jgi:hypothetical protein
MTVVAGALTAVVLWGSLLAMVLGRRRSQRVAWWCTSTDFDAITGHLESIDRTCDAVAEDR